MSICLQIFQGCGSGSGRIRNVLPGSEIIIPDPDPTNKKTGEEEGRKF